MFGLVNIIVIIAMSIISYTVYNRKAKKKKSFREFIIGEKQSMKGIILGLSFGMVFGFLDNFGLLIGIEQMTKGLKLNNLQRSALGNTYSDFIGATIGTFISIILKQSFDYNDDDEPIWLDTLGILLGCILGYYIPTYAKKILSS